MKKNKFISLLMTAALVAGTIACPVYANNDNSELAYLDEISALTAKDGELDETLTIDLENNTVIDNNGAVTDEFDTEFAGVMDMSAEQAEEVLSEQYTVLETAEDQVTIASPYQTKRLIVTGGNGKLKKEYGARVALHHGNEYILQFDTEEETKAAYEKLLNDKKIQNVWVDQVLVIEDKEMAEIEAASMTGAEPGEHFSWGVEAMGLDVMSDRLTEKGDLPEVVVAVIDTGLNYNNPYVKGRVAEGGKNFSASSGDYMDNFGHGTHVSGIVIDGTPANVKILPVKVLDDDGRGTQLMVRSGVQYATSMHADVINLSLTGSGSASSSDINVFNAAVNSGAVVCVAAGNSAGDVAYQNPACIDSVLSISNMTKARELSASSCYGDGIEFTAPGASILSAYKTGLGTKSGTSMASPHVAAAAALIKSTDKNLNQAAIFEIFKQNCEDLGAPGKDNKFGYGLINLSNYLPAVETVPEPEPEPEPPVVEPEPQPEPPVVHTHSYISSVTKAPGCTTNGVTTYKCECGDSYTVSIPATGHKYTESVTKNAGCAVNGVITYKCKCGDSYTVNIPATGHKYTESVTRAPGCTASGMITYKCSCGDSYTVSTPAVGHKYQYVLKLGNLYTYRCTVCKQVYTTNKKIK